MRFFHCSPMLFEPGDLILPGVQTGLAAGGNWQGDEVLHKWTYLSRAVFPHVTIANRAWWRDWWVYEVWPEHAGDAGIGALVCTMAIVQSRLGRVQRLAKEMPNAGIWRRAVCQDDGHTYGVPETDHQVDVKLEAMGLGGYLYYARD